MLRQSAPKGAVFVDTENSKQDNALMTLRNGFTHLCASAVIVVTSGLLAGFSNQVIAAEDSDSAELLSFSYRRLLPLEGGSNFRDLGGYPTDDGGQVKRGLLFRSGAMTRLTDKDQNYLDSFGFKTIVDLRSTEEVELYPNHWAVASHIDYLRVPYSIMKMMAQAVEVSEHKDGDGHGGMYDTLLTTIKPQLKLYFEALLQGRAPLVVNCSAGQDRTGVTSALLLASLGVSREQIVEDYLLSTDFRRPLIEAGGVDLSEAAKTNGFAAMMLQYGEGKDPSRPSPLVTAEGVPFIVATLEGIEKDHGAIEAYLTSELGLSKDDLSKLRELYVAY